MKRFTKSGLANTLQIAAIFILFCYPGCSPDKPSKEATSAAITQRTGDTAIQLKTIDFKALEEFDNKILLNQ